LAPGIEVRQTRQFWTEAWHSTASHWFQRCQAPPLDVVPRDFRPSARTMRPRSETLLGLDALSLPHSAARSYGKTVFRFPGRAREPDCFAGSWAMHCGSPCAVIPAEARTQYPSALAVFTGFPLSREWRVCGCAFGFHL